MVKDGWRERMWMNLMEQQKNADRTNGGPVVVLELHVVVYDTNNSGESLVNEEQVQPMKHSLWVMVNSGMVAPLNRWTGTEPDIESALKLLDQVAARTAST
ncbi:unnamed protein product [Toxocara canis]|uniref:Uncharacterized protein n=1 Tax=Toxocara canis TaxID=6265 RepID=A0A183UL85_TOXCA|nr:unnamed protein product [Toxocara canis]